MLAIPDTKLTSAPSPASVLRGYQTDSIAAVRTSYATGHRAPLLVMPTAAGKTIVFRETARLAQLRAFHRSQQLRERFKAMEQQFDKEAAAAGLPEGLQLRVRAVLAEHADLRWDDAIQVVLDETQLSRVRAEKERAKRKSGDFTSDSDDDGEAQL
jgi:type I site-specific restriction endonuclease